MAVTKDDITGKWQSQVWYVDWQGKRKRKHKRGFNSKKEALAWERAFLGEAHGEKVTMASLIAAFKNNINTKVELGKLKESTAYTKTNYLARYIEPYFTDVNAEKVLTRHINEWLKTLNKKSHRGDRLSSGTLNVIRNLLSQVFEFGIDHYGLTINPVTRSEHSESFTNDKRAKLWSIEQYNTFYRALKEEHHKVIFNTMFWGGLRIGELVVLTPNDIGDNVIHVVKNNMHIGPKETKIGTTKNKSSTRDVAIPPKLCLQIKSYIAHQIGLAPTDQIFDIKERTIRSVLDYRAEKLGLPKISPHILRHSYASHSIAKCNDLAAVAKQLGHKSPKTTLKTYSHMVPGADINQAEILNKFVEI